MANHKSALKAHKKSLIKAERNRRVKSRIKTFITKFEKAVTDEKTDFSQLTAIFRSAESEVMKSVSKKVLKLNTAARKVSKMSRALKTVETRTA